MLTRQPQLSALMRTQINRRTGWPFDLPNGLSTYKLAEMKKRRINERRELLSELRRSIEITIPNAKLQLYMK